MQASLHLSELSKQEESKVHTQACAQTSHCCVTVQYKHIITELNKLHIFHNGMFLFFPTMLQTLWIYLTLHQKVKNSGSPSLALLDPPGVKVLQPSAVRSNFVSILCNSLFICCSEDRGFKRLKYVRLKFQETFNNLWYMQYLCEHLCGLSTFFFEWETICLYLISLYVYYDGGI